MEQLLRRYFYVVTLLVLLGCAYFMGTGISQIIAAIVFPPEQIATAAPTTRPSLQAPSAVQTRYRDPSAILARNFFDSVTGPLNAVSSEVGVDSAAGGIPTRCEGGLQLVSTMVSSASAWSVAVIKSGGQTLLYREGSALGTQTVSRIGWQLTFLRSPGGAECFLGMFGAQDLMPARPATAFLPPPVAPGATGLEAEIARGIEQVGASEFNINRGLVDRILENQTALMQSARIIPHEEGGRLVGVKMFGISRESLLGRLGMQNGDVLHSINNYELTSPDRALEAYARLRSADRLTVTVSRRGARQNLDYNIR